MEVGVLDSSPTGGSAWHIIKTLVDFDIVPVVLYLHIIVREKQSLAKLIRDSGIKHWIFSGSPQSVNNDSSLKVPLDCFLNDVNYLLICYSMESVLKQRGSIVHERYTNRKEFFKLTCAKAGWLFDGLPNPFHCWRNHRGYLSGIIPNFTELASYRGEIMIGVSDNLLFTQFHPEKTHYGKLLIKNWLNKIC